MVEGARQVSWLPAVTIYAFPVLNRWQCADGLPVTVARPRRLLRMHASRLPYYPHRAGHLVPYELVTVVFHLQAQFPGPKCE